MMFSVSYSLKLRPEKRQANTSRTTNSGRQFVRLRLRFCLLFHLPASGGSIAPSSSSPSSSKIQHIQAYAFIRLDVNDNLAPRALEREYEVLADARRHSSLGGEGQRVSVATPCDEGICICDARAHRSDAHAPCMGMVGHGSMAAYSVQIERSVGEMIRQGLLSLSLSAPLSLMCLMSFGRREEVRLLAGLLARRLFRITFPYLSPLLPSCSFSRREGIPLLACAWRPPTSATCGCTGTGSIGCVVPRLCRAPVARGGSRMKWDFRV